MASPKASRTKKKKKNKSRNIITPRVLGITFAIILMLIAIHLAVSLATYSIDDFYVGETILREIPDFEEMSKFSQFFQKINIIKRFRPPRPLLNKGGYLGALIVFPLRPTFGLLAFFIPILCVFWSVSIFARIRFSRAIVKTLIVLGFWILISVLFGLPGGYYFVGDFGLKLATQLKLLLGSVGAWAFTIAFFLSYLWLTIGAETLEPLFSWIRKKNEERKEQAKLRKELERQELLKEHELRTKRRKEMLDKIEKVGKIEPGKIENKRNHKKATESKEFDKSRYGEKNIEIMMPLSSKKIDEAPLPPDKNDEIKEQPTGGAFSIDVAGFFKRRKKEKAAEPSIHESIIEQPHINDDEMEIMVSPKDNQSSPIAKPERDYSGLIEEPKGYRPESRKAERSVEDELEEMSINEFTPNKPGGINTEDDALGEKNVINEVDEEPVCDGDAVSAGLTRAREIAQKSDTTEKIDTELIKDDDNQDAFESKEYYYRPPRTDLLDEPDEWGFSVDERRVQEQSKLLEETLEHFKINGEITRVTPGPVITRFEYRPERGIKISKISNLADDLAMALKALNIRIIAPIPGKDVVGMEIPNDEKKTVYIKEILLSDEFKDTRARLPIALGSAVDGSTVVSDLAKAPHLLIAGATGSGKSVCVNSIITSLLYSHTPKSLRLLLVDPKRLELSIYNGIPHLLSEVIVEPKHSAEAFKWAVEEMTSRYRMLADVNVRNLADFNDKVKRLPDLEMEPLPRIVLIVDELADLMMTVSAHIEEPIARLAQMARAVGIHLILATQRPSVDVLTGLIKANFPSRIAFKVRSQIDSRTIIDMGGAERLLGYGDMLFLNSTLSEPQRVHGSFISTEETERIVKQLKAYPNPEELQDFSVPEEGEGRSGEIERDELLPQAAKLVVINQKGSASMLQRKLRIGYNRAGSIIDSLEMMGIVGPPKGSKPRDVLIKEMETLSDILSMKGL